MNNKVINFVIIIVIIVVAALSYSLGIFAKNVIANSKSETAEILSESGLEIDSEIPNEISESDFDYDSDDLTNNEDCVIIIEENEPTVEDVIMNECGLVVIDYVALIDSYEDSNWYAYYIYSDGDCYVITLKNNHVDVCCQLN